VVESHPSSDLYKPDQQSLVNWLGTTGTRELGRSLDQVDTEASMRPSALRFVRDPDCSDIPQTVPSSMSATGTNGLKSSLFIFSPVQSPWLSGSMTSQSLLVTGHSLALTVRGTQSIN